MVATLVGVPWALAAPLRLPMRAMAANRASIVEARTTASSSRLAWQGHSHERGDGEAGLNGATRKKRIEREVYTRSMTPGSAVRPSPMAGDPGDGTRAVFHGDLPSSPRLNTT